MTATILPFPAPPELVRRNLAAHSRIVACPWCDAPAGRPCVNRGTVQIRITGPHAARLAAAELEGEPCA
jgi:hypothetical protein